MTKSLNYYKEIAEEIEEIEAQTIASLNHYKEVAEKQLHIINRYGATKIIDVLDFFNIIIEKTLKQAFEKYKTDKDVLSYKEQTQKIKKYFLTKLQKTVTAITAKRLQFKASIILHLQREHTELNTSQLEISTYSKLLSLHP